MRSLFKLFTSSLLVLLSTTFTQIGQANAATVETAILFGDLAITKVLGLNANGTTYDVTFSYGHAEEFNWTPRKTSPVQPFSDSLRWCFARRGRCGDRQGSGTLTSVMLG